MASVDWIGGNRFEFTLENNGFAHESGKPIQSEQHQCPHCRHWTARLTRKINGPSGGKPFSPHRGWLEKFTHRVCSFDAEGRAIEPIWTRHRSTARPALKLALEDWSSAMRLHPFIRLGGISSKTCGGRALPNPARLESDIYFPIL